MYNMPRKLGGRIRHYLLFWKQITCDKLILNQVQGVKLEFASFPRRQIKLPHDINMTKEEMLFVNKKIAQLLANDSIAILPPEKLTSGWLSNIFLVPKKVPGEFRMILNLKGLNQYIQYRKFKMDQIYKVLDMIQPEMWATLINLVDAYSHLFVSPGHWSYLAF